MTEGGLKRREVLTRPPFGANEKGPSAWPIGSVAGAERPFLVLLVSYVRRRATGSSLARDRHEDISPHEEGKAPIEAMGTAWPADVVEYEIRCRLTVETDDREISSRTRSVRSLVGSREILRGRRAIEGGSIDRAWRHAGRRIVAEEKGI